MSFAAALERGSVILSVGVFLEPLSWGSLGCSRGVDWPFFILVASTAVCTPWMLDKHVLPSGNY